MSRSGIQRKITAGLWARIHLGVFLILGSPRTWRQSLLAACLVAGPDAFASHSAAAELLGLSGVPKRLEITVAHQRRLVVDGVVVHRTRHLDRADRCRVEGIPCTSVARTLIDLAECLQLRQLEQVLDDALARRLVPLAYLRNRVHALGISGMPGRRQLAEVIDARLKGPYIPPSRFERKLQEVLAEYGLPAVREHWVRLDNGTLRRIDFAFPEVMLAVEADSYRHHSSLPDWEADRIRNNELVAIGWSVVSVTYLDLVTNPAAVADQIARALARR